MVRIMKGSRAPHESIEAIKHCRCNACATTDNAPPTRPVESPSPYAFNHDLHIDALDLFDYEDVRHSFLSVVECGNFSPSLSCPRGRRQPFVIQMSAEFPVAGWPTNLTTCRRTRNKGVFEATLAKSGVHVRPVGWEGPEHLSRREGHGDICNNNLKRTIR